MKIQRLESDEQTQCRRRLGGGGAVGGPAAACASLALWMVLLLLAPFNAAAVCPTCEVSVVVGKASVRIQVLSSTLVRVEMAGAYVCIPYHCSLTHSLTHSPFTRSTLSFINPRQKEDSRYIPYHCSLTHSLTHSPFTRSTHSFVSPRQSREGRCVRACACIPYHTLLSLTHSLTHSFFNPRH
jgi:hypothetical protein